MACGDKIELCVGYYIDTVLENPDFVFFTVSEVMSGNLTNQTMLDKVKSLEKSHFAGQLKALHTSSKISFHPVNLFWNVSGMIFFPFLTRPRMLDSGYFTSEEFKELMLERKRLIPIWMKQIVNA